MRSWCSRRSVLSLALPLLASCAPSWGFLETSFEPELHHYDIAYQSAATHAVISDGWLAENFRMSGTRPVPIETSTYRVALSIDFDRDGRAESHIDAARVDLRLLHRTTGNVIWLRTVPLDFAHADLTLETLAQTYVESLAGTHYFSGQFASPVRGTARTHATQIISATPTTIDGLEAYDVTLDVIDLDQRALDPNAVADRVRIVFARPREGHGFQVSQGLIKTVVTFGHAARPAVFDQTAGEFDELLTRVRWR